MITNHAEGTFVSLRYFLGGDRPSQTTRLAVSPVFHKPGLESEQNKGGISHYDSTDTSVPASKSPTYSTHVLSRPSAKVQ